MALAIGLFTLKQSQASVSLPDTLGNMGTRQMGARREKVQFAVRPDSHKPAEKWSRESCRSATQCVCACVCVSVCVRVCARDRVRPSVSVCVGL